MSISPAIADIFEKSSRKRLTNAKNAVTTIDRVLLYDWEFLRGGVMMSLFKSRNHYECDCGCEPADSDFRCSEFSVIDIVRRTFAVCLFVVLLASLILVLVRLLGDGENTPGTEFD
jgi:hypothetical protein